MIELEKLYTLTLENLHNFSVYQIIEISLVLHNAYVVSRNYNKFMFYINNYIDQNQFNQLYDLDQIKKDIQNPNAVICKLGSTLTRSNNYRLEVAKEKNQKKRNGRNAKKRNYGRKML